MKKLITVLVCSALALSLLFVLSPAKPEKPQSIAPAASLLYEFTDEIDLAEHASHIIVAKVLEEQSFAGNISQIKLKVEETYKGQCEEEIYWYDDVLGMKLKKNKSYLLFLGGAESYSYPHTVYSLEDKEAIYEIKGNKLESLSVKGERYIKTKYNKDAMLEMITGLTEDKSYKAVYTVPETLSDQELYDLSTFIGIVEVVRYSESNQYVANMNIAVKETLKGNIDEELAYSVAVADGVKEGDTILYFLNDVPDFVLFPTAKTGAVIKEDNPRFEELKAYVLSRNENQ